MFYELGKAPGIQHLLNYRSLSNHPALFRASYNTYEGRKKSEREKLNIENQNRTGAALPRFRFISRHRPDSDPWVPAHWSLSAQSDRYFKEEKITLFLLFFVHFFLSPASLKLLDLTPCPTRSFCLQTAFNVSNVNTIRYATFFFCYQFRYSLIQLSVIISGFQMSPVFCNSRRLENKKIYISVSVFI